MTIIKLILKIILYVFGSFLIFWSIICFFGGPEGRIGSIESLVWGIVYLGPGLLFIKLGKLLKTSHNDAES